MFVNIRSVLLAHAFFLRNDTKQFEEKIKPYPPLATLFAASVLREQGCTVSLFDAVLSTGMDQFENKLKSCKPQLLVICEDHFNFLTKMCLNHVRQATIKMIALAKRAGIPVIVSSSDATDNQLAYLERGADFVILGEVELSLGELVTWFNQPEKQYQDMPMGVVYLSPESGRPENSNFRKNISNLDVLPRPAWDLVNFGPYQRIWKQHHGYYSINMVSSRGCPYACNWCAKPLWGQQYYSHSPEYIVEQMVLLNKLAQPDHIWFTDDIFGGKEGWIEQFAEIVTKRALNVPFTIQSRADLMDRQMVKALKTSGCEEVWLGVESGSQKILDAMNKGITVEQIVLARKLLKQAGIKTGFFLQLGYLGEELQDIELTRQLILAEQPEIIGVSVSYPLPGTVFYQQVQSQIADKTNWQESNDLDTVFNATFHTSFYRKIRNHLHDELKAHPSRNGARGWTDKWNALMASAEDYRNQNTLN